MMDFFDIVANYMTLQLVRCAAVSVLLMAVILLLRCLFKKTTFLKGLLWSLLLLSPFFGRLTAYYELNAISKISWGWITVCMNYRWISWLYFTGIFIMLCLTIKNRYKLNHFVKNMDKMKVCGMNVYVCPASITPFTTGVFSPKIVIPEFMLHEYSDEELESVLLHEQTHIRLMHMFLYLIWDILHILLWVNPLFKGCLKYFRQDMEDICDIVTIQRSGGDGYKYGRLLIKSLELLNNKTNTGDDDNDMFKANMTVTFAGEDQFSQMKQRIIRVVGFRGYKKAAVLFMLAVSVLIIAVFAVMIGSRSYARYENDERILVYNRTGEKLLINDYGLLRDIVSHDDNFIYVDADAFVSVLDTEKIPLQTVTISFGGYSKLPGYGGGGYCEFLEPDMLGTSMAKIPYISKQSPLTWIFKYI